MEVKIRKYSFKFGEEIIGIKKDLVKEVEDVIYMSTFSLSDLSRQKLNAKLETYFISKNWSQMLKGLDECNIEFFKNNVALKIRTSHPSFMGADMLEFELGQKISNEKIDAGVYIVVTSQFRKHMINDYNIKWEGSLTFEKAQKELERYKNVINCPILLVGIDLDD